MYNYNTLDLLICILFRFTVKYKRENATTPQIGGIRIDGKGLTQITIEVTHADDLDEPKVHFDKDPAPGEFMFEEPSELQEIIIYFYSKIQTNVSVDLYGCMGSKYYLSSFG